MDRSNLSHSYSDVLKYFLPYYEKTKLNCSSKINNEIGRDFTNPSNIKIIGVVQYEPFKVSEVKKFRKNFIGK